MFNFNKVINNVTEKLSEPEQGTGEDSAFSNVGKKDENISQKLVEIENMYTLLLDGDEMGIITKEEVQKIKDDFNFIRAKFPEEVNALYGKTPVEIKSGLNNLLEKIK